MGTPSVYNTYIYQHTEHQVDSYTPTQTPTRPHTERYRTGFGYIKFRLYSKTDIAEKQHVAIHAYIHTYST